MFVNDLGKSPANISFQVKSDEPVQHDEENNEEESKRSLKHEDLDKIEEEEEKEDAIKILDDDKVKFRMS